MDAKGLKLVYVLGTYPVLTTTFIDREIRLLREAGADVTVVSIRRPAGPLSPEQEVLRAGVRYLLPVRALEHLGEHLRLALVRPGAYVRTLLYLLTRPHPSPRARLWTLLHFAEGVRAAHLLRGLRFAHIHAHFIDRAAVIALVVSRLRGVPYSITAHANDIYVGPVLLREKLAGAKFVATCTEYNRAYLARFADGAADGKLRRIYHGLDVSRYAPARSGGGPVPLLVSVGQLKEKKGFSHLLRACAALKAEGRAFECLIIGEGPQRAALEAQIGALGLGEHVTLCGALPHDGVIDAYRRATLFVLAPVVSRDGDRDGIPNVILEAMAMALPVVSTAHSGIPEVIENGVNGLLVPPGDEAALARALARLLDAPDLRWALGENARRTVAERFDITQNVRALLAEFIATE